MLSNKVHLGAGHSVGLEITIMAHLYQCSVLYSSVSALKVLGAMCSLASLQPLTSIDLTVISVCAFPRR